MALINKLSAIGDAIREKTGKEDLLTLDQMPEEIKGISGGGGDLEPIVISGNASYCFAYGNWDWVMKKYPNLITTKDIQNAEYMFQSSKTDIIPFTINFSETNYSHEMKNMFYACGMLKTPKITNNRPGNMALIFSQCEHLKEITEDFYSNIDWSFHKEQTSAYACNKSGMFYACRSLRQIPNAMLKDANPYARNTYTYFYEGFRQCYVLDELVDLPIPYTVDMTTNMFSSILEQDYRLKRFTFETDNGQPLVKNWSKQQISLKDYIGWCMPHNDIIKDMSKHNGITEDKKVIDDATYQALKNDPDWYTQKYEYSRYNKTSAVETINSLPDTSAYLLEKGGTNTITFYGNAGSLTDGGAINTMTAEEIAVATAKGWTVSLV